MEKIGRETEGKKEEYRLSSKILWFENNLLIVFSTIRQEYLLYLVQ